MNRFTRPDRIRLSLYAESLAAARRVARDRRRFVALLVALLIAGPFAVHCIFKLYNS